MQLPNPAVQVAFYGATDYDGSNLATFSLRSYYWGDVHVLVAHGALELDAASSLASKLTRMQRDSTVFVDLWDVDYLDRVCIGLLATAKLRADKTKWDFALIADPGGPVSQQLENAGLAEALRPYATKQDARAAQRFSPG